MTAATGEEMMSAMTNHGRAPVVGNNVPLAMESFMRADCVCFDVDSTLIAEEGIDVLADYLGKGEQVAALTKQAMEGGMKFQDALAARLELLQPSKQEIQSCLVERPLKLTAGVEELMERLHDADKHVYLVSGGFRIMIEPVAEQLQIPPANIYANTLYFEKPDANDATQQEASETKTPQKASWIFSGDDGEEHDLYVGFDDEEPTSQDGGKAKALELIRTTSRVTTDGKETPVPYECMVMIGDGFTDAQAKPPAKAFIGFGGVVVRENVRDASDWFITDFQDLIRLMDEFPNRNYKPFFPKN